MAKLYFRYGAMGSAKTSSALLVRYNYEERGQAVILAKPRIDNRDGERVIVSRTGMSHECIYVDELLKMMSEQIREYACVIVDEAQFLSKDDVRRLADIVDILNVPVICYGLRADFRNELFPGSAELLAIADSISEVKTICWCGKKATCNARFGDDGVIIRDGPQVVLGSNDSYIAVCREHFNTGEIRAERTEM